MTDAAELLQMQVPLGIPRSNFFEVVSDPLLPPQSTTEMLAHFYSGIYDLSAESHLTRLLKVILGDTGVGQLRKRYTYSHLSQFLLTTHYNDLDQMYAQIFGLYRLIRERLTIDPYLSAVTEDEWEALNAADASYRARVEGFSRSLSMAGTPLGMAMAATALLGEQCRVYESYPFVDDADIYTEDVSAETYTYGELEAFTYAELSRQTYSELEGTQHYSVRLIGSRGEFVVRPLRTISTEERLQLTRVLGRLKPANALLTIDSRPATVHRPVSVNRAAASSTYWQVRKRVLVAEENAAYYDNADPSQPLEQPRFAFSAFQGEAWSYNGDVISVESYVEDEDGNRIADVDYERQVNEDGTTLDFLPEQAIADQAKILLGRSVSDGVLTVPPALREEVDVS